MIKVLATALLVYLALSLIPSDGAERMTRCPASKRRRPPRSAR